jgi:hypothetical protein
MQTLGSDIAPATARGKFFGANRFIAETGSLTNPASFSALLWLFGGTAATYAGAFFFWSGAAVLSATLVARLIKETLSREPSPRNAPS